MVISVGQTRKLNKNGGSNKLILVGAGWSLDQFGHRIHFLIQFRTALSSGSTMRDLAVDYARDLRVVGIYVSSVFTCCRFLRAGGFCLLPFFWYNTTIKKSIITHFKNYL